MLFIFFIFHLPEGITYLLPSSEKNTSFLAGILHVPNCQTNLVIDHHIYTVSIVLAFHKLKSLPLGRYEPLSPSKDTCETWCCLHLLLCDSRIRTDDRKKTLPMYHWSHCTNLLAQMHVIELFCSDQNNW